MATMCHGRTGVTMSQPPTRPVVNRRERIAEKLREAQRQLVTMLTDLQSIRPRQPTPAEQLMAELKLPRNRNIIATVNTQTGEIGSVVIAPTTADAPLPLGEARRHELTQQLDALERIAQDGLSSVEARKHAAIEAAKLRKLLSTVAA